MTDTFSRTVWTALLAFVAVLTPLPTQSASGQEPSQAQKPPAGGDAPKFLGIHSDEPPATSVDRTTTEAAGQSARRDLRDNRWSSQLLEPLEDPGLHGYLGPESTTVTHIDYVGSGREALPAESSNCVVFGHVQSAKAFVTPDRKGVYSEFSIVVDSIVGQDSTQHIAPGGTLLGIRGGGTVVFPSGHERRVLFEGIGYPKIGTQYLFFLRVQPNSDDYGILTAYELINGKAYPLDDGKPFLRYEGVNQASLLKSVNAKLGAGPAFHCFANQAGAPPFSALFAERVGGGGLDLSE